LVAAAAIAGVVAGSTSAGAVTQDGQLLGKVTGSAYSPDTLLWGVSKAGKPAVYSYEIKNTGTVQTQYELGLVPQQGNAIWQIFDGKTPISVAKYITPPVAPGAYYKFTVQGSIPAGGLVRPSNATMDVGIIDTSIYLTTADMYLFEGSSSFTGSTDADFFYKSGAQPWVNGDQQAEESAAVARGKSGQFTIRVQNDTAASHDAVLIMESFADGCAASSFRIQVKLGTRDVSAQLPYTGGGLPVTLAPGAHIMLKASITYVGPDTACLDGYAFLRDIASVGGRQAQIMTPVAAQ
jgi:hypothetical protein